MLAASLFDPLYHLIGWLLAIFYLPTKSVGVSIILMTIVVMAIQFPLITKQTRSMLQMQRVQPEIKRIQQKYKDDRQKQNEELLKFYQENKINPLAGCLPLLLIVPIGITVFGSFRGPGLPERVPKTGTFAALYEDMCTERGGHTPATSTIEKKNEDTGKTERTTITKQVPPSGTLLTRNAPAGSTVEGCDDHVRTETPDALRFLGMKLNHSTADALDEGVVDALPYLVVLLIVILTGWYQVRQTQARQERQGTPINPQMQTITRIMPVFFGFISYTLSTATTIYFAVSNVWRIGQQHFVLNKMYEEAAAEKAAGKSAPTVIEAESPPAAKPSSSKGSGSSAKSGGGSGAGAAPKRPPAQNTSNRKKKRRRR